MIFIITADDRAFEQQVVAHLAERSVHPIAARDVNSPARFDPARHYVVYEVSDLAAMEARLHSVAYRVVALGTLDASSAHLHLAADKEDLFEQLEAFVGEAMSSFERPSWDMYFMDIAKVVGRRSNCMKRQVAAVVVKDKRIVSTGYNGTPRGAKNCNEGGCPRCNGLAPAGSALDECLCNHAEENAVAQAAYHGIAIRSATIYCTFSPCLRCTKLIINAGIAEVVYNARYDLDDRSLALLTECGVKVRSVDEG